MSYIDKVGPSIKPKFRARWRDPSGKQRAKTFDRRAEAVAFLIKIDAAKNAGTYVDPKHGKVLVRDFAAEWLAARDTRASTQARDASLVNRYIVAQFGGMPIGAIRRAEVAAWHRQLGKSPATTAKILTLFKAMLSGAVHDGLLPANPLDGLKLPVVEREEMRFLTSEELLRLADAIDERYRALVFVGGYGGLRIGELAGLRRDRIDMLRGVIDVPSK